MDNLLIEVARSDLSFLRTGVIVKTSGCFWYQRLGLSPGRTSSI